MRGKIRNQINAFVRKDEGASTVMALFFGFSMLMLSGYAIDLSNAMAVRTQMQVAADAAAHAAILEREFGTPETAVAKALEIAERNMPADRHGFVIEAQDVQFGDYDPATTVFTPDPDATGAVRVIARRTTDRGNPHGNYFLALAGIETMDIVTGSVFVTYRPTCLREGFVAELEVDLQSNNEYRAGFCIHSNNTISLNNNNIFETGTVVSLSDVDNLELPNSGYEQNEGLREALREGTWNIRILERIDNIIAGLYAMDDRFVPDYILGSGMLTLSTTNLNASHFTSGRVHTYDCPTSNGRLSFANGTILRDVVLVTDCQIKMGNQMVLENVVIATTNTASKSIYAPQDLQIGRDDNCAEGGGSQLITMGSVDVAGNLKMYGGQILAKVDVSFAANAGGLHGAAIVAGGTISGTSNMDMGFCGSGMENNFMAEYFRLAI
ncbi:hypothetical protein E7811_02620 [Aliigemmobacter aestuarii]|uniref:Uncharacterized protein n=1 Tax=Aliigemmobacter aestuarii TaxID=1445661 RepID=A0A4S3MQC8_9RHOB|nr:pilus assembly protein TadG-related protein [Gemmobacter aestuarii]THD84649.1 hypothetical protein E7811_02620 [Gemmobacter aestuarii]